MKCKPEKRIVNTWTESKLKDSVPVFKKIRKGAATLDYFLLICVVLPMIGFAIWAGPRIMSLVYDLTSMVIGWPFM